MSFPHVYGPINRDAVLATTPITATDGRRVRTTGSCPARSRRPGSCSRRHRRRLAGVPQDSGRSGGAPPPRRCGRRATRPTHAVPRSGSKGCLAIERTAQVVGFVLLGFYRTGDFEISYLLLPEHQRQGYAREAVSTAAEWAFAVFTHLPRLVAVTPAGERAQRPAARRAQLGRRSTSSSSGASRRCCTRCRTRPRSEGQAAALHH